MVWHYCIQQGIHVAWEWSEKCDAWRLPLIQDLFRRYEPHMSVTKGCQVKLRDGAGKLLQKGWKVMTTHKRLSELLHRPCRCDGKYVHGKCEGKMAEGSAMYTKEFGRLVVKAMQQELTMPGVVQESQGKSQTPDLFGCGSACMCAVTRQSMHVQSCASCVLGEREEEEEGEEKRESAFVTQNQKHRQEAEEQARMKATDHELGWETMEDYLRNVQLPLPRKGRGFLGGESVRPPYYQFGAYNHGPFRGVSKRTQQHEEMCRYINAFLRKHAPTKSTWTSFVVSYNNAMPWHRDGHNLKGSKNYTCAMGEYSGGELQLWMGGSEEAGPEGVEKVSTYHRVVSFSPDTWHATCSWKGERITISAYTIRSVQDLSGAQREQLHACGFQCHSRGNRSCQQPNSTAGMNPPEKRRWSKKPSCHRQSEDGLPLKRNFISFMRRQAMGV